MYKRTNREKTEKRKKRKLHNTKKSNKLKYNVP
jgi:hypothetical protein